MQGGVKGGSKTSNVWALPKTRNELCEQARGAVLRGIADGIQRQRVEFQLPVAKREYSLAYSPSPSTRSNTIKEEFYAATVTASSVLGDSPLPSTSSRSTVLKRRVDDGLDAEPVALLSTSDSPLRLLNGTRALVFPTAETMPFIQEVLQEDRSRPLLIVNPQWSLTRNILDDFGFGANRQRARELADSFTSTYSIAELNIGNTRSFDRRIARKSGTVWVLHCYPGGWQVYAAPPLQLQNEVTVDVDEAPELLSVFDYNPAYNEIETLLNERNMNRLVNQKHSHKSGKSKSRTGKRRSSSTESLSETTDENDASDSISTSEAENARLNETFATQPRFPSGEIDRMPEHLLLEGLKELGELGNASQKSVDGLRRQLKSAVSRSRGKLIEQGDLSVDESEQPDSQCRVCSGDGKRPCPMCAPTGRTNFSCEFCGGWGYTLCPACVGGLVDVGGPTNMERGSSQSKKRSGLRKGSPRASEGLDREELVKSGKSTQAGRACSICGQPGHNKRSCPYARNRQTQQS